MIRLNPKQVLRQYQMPIIIFILAFSILFLRIFVNDWGRTLLSPYSHSDAFYYHHKAWFAAFIHPNGGELSWVFNFSPYISLIKLAYQVIGPYPMVPFLVNALLVSSAAAFIAAASRHLFTELEGWSAGLLMTLCAPIVFFSGTTARTSLAILCVSAFIYFCASYFTRQSLWKLACIFVFLYLATIERNNLAILLPISVIFFAFVYPDEFKIKKAFQTFTFITAVLLLAMILTYSQQDQDGRKFLSPMGLNFYMGNNPKATGAHTESVKELGLRHDAVGHITQSHAIAEKAVGQSLSETEAGWYWIRKSLNFMYTEPQSYIQLKLKQVGLFFAYAASGLPEDYRVWRLEDPVLKITFVNFGVIFSLALMGLIQLQRQALTKKYAFLLFSAVSYAGSVWIFYIIERLRIPFILLLTPFAAYGICSVLRKLPTVEYKTIFLGLGTYLFSFSMAFLNTPAKGWSDDFQQSHNELKVLRKQRAALYESMYQAIHSKDSEDWTKLSRELYRYSLQSDAETVAYRAIDAEPGVAKPYWLLYLNYRKAENREKLRTLLAMLEYTQGKDPYNEKHFRVLKKKIVEDLKNE